jgi:succinyl-CoA synthetase beta subunit
MNIHEYQAKSLFTKASIPIPKGNVVFTPTEAVLIAKTIKGTKWVVKAQIHAGGRGKAGGVKIANSLSEVQDYATELLGKNLVTHQTGPGGRTVRKLLIEEALPIAHELYAAILFDRTQSCPVLIASAAGGMDIEEVAAKTPEKIYRLPIPIQTGMCPYQARKAAFALGLSDKTALKTARLLEGLYKLFIESDATMVEVNPLIITDQGEPVALDGKIGLDDNALYRHPDIAAFRDLDEEDPLEIEAGKNNLNYIKLDGSVGCMVNGAGLAMATMDIIKLAGSSPANFLDVGGGASVERVAAAFRILMADPNVKAVLINIFGGIVRCDRVAGGVIQALEQVKVDLPIIIRLEGTNSIEAGQLLANAPVRILVATSFQDAADKVIQALQK